MVGFYNKSEREAPALVQWVDRLLAHKQAILITAAAVILLLAVLSIFQPRVGLSLLAVAFLAIVIGFVAIRATARHHTHWKRDSHRR